MPSNLLFHFLLITVMDVEVPELVGVLLGSNDTEPITEGVLLQILLGQILQIPLGERRLGRDGDLSLLPGDADLVPQNTGLPVDLHTVMEKLLEDSGVKESIVDGGRQVQDELQVGGLLSTLLGGLLGPGLLDGSGCLSFDHFGGDRGRGKREEEKREPFGAKIRELKEENPYTHSFLCEGCPHKSDSVTCF